MGFWWRVAGVLLALCSAASSQDAAARLSGTVVDAAGAPMTDMAVRLIDRGRTVITTTSNQDGRYSFTVPGAGVYDIEIHIPGFRTRRIVSIEVSSSEQKAIPNVTAVPGSVCEVPSEQALIVSKGSTTTVAGRLTDEDGSAFVGGLIRLRSYKDLEHPVAVRTDKEGRYEFRDVVPGGYALLLETADYLTSLQIWADAGFDLAMPEVRLEHCKTPGCTRVIGNVCS